MLSWINVIGFSEFRSQKLENLKTCPEKIENKSYHRRCILRLILEDGNVNEVSFEMTFKRNESLCLVLKPLENEQKRVPYSVFDVSSICLQYYLNFFLIREPLPILAQRDSYQNAMKPPIEPNCPTLQNNRNKIYQIAKKCRKTFSTFPND